MNTPQIIWIVLAGLSVGISLAMHGEKIDYKYSFYRKVSQVGVMVGLLYWGGFFS